MKNKYYNIIFPIWLLILLPLTWIVVLPANFLIDSLVLIITMKYLKVEKIKTHWKSCVLKVWGFGFLSDILASLMLMFLPDFFLSVLPDNIHYQLLSSVQYNPLESIWAFLIVTVFVIIAGIMIYFFNMKYSFKKLKLNSGIKRKLALSLAIFTAPYLFYLPTMWFV